MMDIIFHRNIFILFICIIGLYFGREIYIEYQKSDALYVNNAAMVNEYNKAIRAQQEQDMTNDELIRFHKNMYNLYHDGIADRYDLKQNKINGVAPDPRMAISHLDKAIDLGYTDGYILMGKMYHYGIHDLPVDLDKALVYYQYIVNHKLKGNNEALKNISTIKKHNHSEYYQKISKWLNLDNNNNNKRETHTKTSFMKEEYNVPVIKIDREDDDDDDDDDGDDVAYRTITPDVITDTQNVHDHTLINTVKDSIHKLQQSTDITVNIEEALQKLRGFIQSKPNTDKKNDALRTLDTIERNSQELISFNMKEVDLLNLVWNRIINNHDDSVDVKNNLFDQLANSVEHDSVVCSTGRFTRLLDTLNVVDENVNIKTRTLINREMMNQSSNIRKQLYDKCSVEEQDELDNPAVNAFSMDFNERLKTQLRTEFKQTYVDTGILSQTDLDTELNVWINYI